MPSGGARARSGPPPDPNAQRRDRDEGEWKILPIDGRQGDPPVWPLPRPTIREKALWAELWSRPQAIMWERLHLEAEVALYVRRFREVEKPGATASLANHLIRMAESLGLTTAGLHRNRWMIEVRRVLGAEPERVGETEEQPAAVVGGRARDRFTVVTGGGD